MGSLSFLIGSGTLSEELLKLQESLSSTCRSSVVCEERQIIQPVIDSSLTESCSVAWAVRNVKHVARIRNENLLQENKALRKDINELQKEGIYYKYYARL